MKKGRLYSYNSQLEKLVMQDSILLELNKQNITNFGKKYQVYMNQLADEVNTLQRVFFEVDENDRLVVDSGNVVYKDGMTKHSFNQNWNVLMKQGISEVFEYQHYDEPVAEEVKAEA